MQNTHSPGKMRIACLGATALLTMSGRPAAAATGDLLRTVNVPVAAQCTETVGGAIGPISTSVAIVPGFVVGKDQPILLVTSCFAAGAQRPTLYFLDPSTNPATLVMTINTTVTPPLGWGSLALRGDKADLLACGNDAGGTHAIYAIDISPFNATPDGTATFLFNAQPGEDICDGVTWDTSDNTVFQSPDVSSTIYHFSEVGGALGSFPSPAGCFNSGVAVGGDSLFAACNGDLIIHQLDKATGAGITSFPTAGQRTEDLECDSETFASMGKDAIWSKDAFSNQLFAFEVPLDTCGLAGGPPVRLPRCPDGTTTDTDGDGLLDCWEIDGIDADGDGVIDFHLYDVNQDGIIQPSEQADPNHKDLYVEVDFMELHQPNATSLTDVVAAFANSPVGNPDGTTGVRLHILVDEQAVAHNTNLAFEPCTGPAGVGTPDFDAVKAASFGTAAERADPNAVNILSAKRSSFRYSLYAHNLLGLGSTSGCSELPGNDFVISLGGWAVVSGHGQGNTDQQEGTFMHELGHTLNLRHGGGNNTNCKPNYLSVMSYSRQINNNPIVGRPLDYSRAALPTLNEASLSEAAGISGPVGDQTAYGPPPTLVTASNAAIDWNRDGDTVDVGVAADINNLGFPGCGAAPGQMLTGYDDWANLGYNFRTSTDFADGVHLTVLEAPEIDREQAAEMGLPVARAGADMSAQCTSPAGAAFHLDGSASSDPDSSEGTNDDIVFFEWFENFGTPSQVLLATGETADVVLHVGSHHITLRVTDTLGHTAVDDLTATTVDTVAPVVAPFTVSPSQLSPPNHKLVTVAVPTILALDTCDPDPRIFCSVSSNEAPDTEGDASTAFDIVFNGEAVSTQGTGSREIPTTSGAGTFALQLRAERSGGGGGRVYTIACHAVDESGNVGATTSTTVLVR
jgi:hypothetical protein